MGVTTDIIGHIRIDPPLNTAEQHYLTAFSESRRFRRPGGPYEVPFNPAAEAREPTDGLDGYNSIALGQPSLWCAWSPSWGGERLSFNGQEKFYGATDWMRYLIDHFLAPGAQARTSGLPWFDEFTFDHRLDGTMAAYPRDTCHLYLIVVANNEVHRNPVPNS